MRGILKQLKAGECSWFTRAALRLAGLALLLASLLIARLCWWMEQFPKLHPATPLEFGVAAMAVVTLSLGIALSIEGAGLFRLQPRPPRMRVFFEDRDDERPDVAGSSVRTVPADPRLHPPL